MFRQAIHATPVLGALCVAILLSGCVDPEEAALERYVSAYQLQEQGQLDAAMAQLNEAVRYKEDFVDAYSLRGDILYHQGRFTEAAENFEHATSLDPSSLHDHYSLGQVYQVLNRFTDAVRAYLRATQIDPLHFDSQFRLGTAYEKLQQYDKAAERYAKAIEIRPKDPLAHYNMAAVFTHLDKPEDAIREYKDALESGVDVPHIWLSLGNAYIQANDFKNAVAVLQRERKQEADKHQPESPFVLRQLAYAEYRLGQLNEAERDYRKVIELEPANWVATSGLGVVLMSRFRADPRQKILWTDALALWEKSLKMNPDQPQIARLAEYYRHLPNIEIDPRTGLPRDPRLGG